MLVLQVFGVVVYFLVYLFLATEFHNGWPWTQSEFSLLLPPKSRNYRWATPLSSSRLCFYEGLRLEPRDSCTQGKHSVNQTKPHPHLSAQILPHYFHPDLNLSGERILKRHGCWGSCWHRPTMPRMLKSLIKKCSVSICASACVFN